MSTKKISLKSFIEEYPLLEKKKGKKKSKSKKKRKNSKSRGGIANAWYIGGLHHGDDHSSGISGGDGGGGMGESLISEIFNGIGVGFSAGQLGNVQVTNKTSNNPEAGLETTFASDDKNDWEWSEEEPEQKVNKVDQARQLFQSLYNRPNATRADIINTFMKDVGVTNSTAVSYYTRFLDEFGLGGKEGGESLGQGVSMGGGFDDHAKPNNDETLSAPVDAEPEMGDFPDPERAGMIRVVDNAHLVYKRQAEDASFEELWIYNIHDNSNDELKIRREIIAGTDIPLNKTKSADGQQQYTISTMGNAQLLHITGLSN